MGFVNLIFISMWSIRRTSSIALRSQTFSAVTLRASYVEHKVSGSSHLDKTKFSRGPLLLNKYSSRSHSQATSNHLFSSLAGTKSNGEDDGDLEDGFSELEADNVTQEKNVEHDDLEDGFSDLEASSTDVIQDKNVEDSDGDLTSEPELSEEEDHDSIITPEKTRKQKKAFSVLFKAIMDSPAVSAQKSLDKWLEKGEKVSRSDVSVAMIELRRRKMFDKALQMSEWLDSRKQLEFTEKDYSSRVDLLAKVRGLRAAEIYIERIPESFKSEMVYSTLLAKSVQSAHTAKAEQVFKKMKELKFPLTSFACNQMLLLYQRTDKKKIADVLVLMEKENVKPTALTYRMLLDVKGQVNDIDGMEQVFETMKAEGIDPDISIQSVMARHYIYGGLKDKAKAVLQEMEGSDLEETRRACLVLLPLYATLGSADDVTRVWEVCKSNPGLDECMNAIDAYGKLRKIEEAEAVFDLMCKKYKRMSSKHYAAMLKVYANNKMLSKGKNLVTQMAESGCQIGPLTWDALVKLYVEAGEIEKAFSILRKASEQNRIKPLFNTYMMIMDQYAKKGDIHSAEKMFHRMRQDGYVARLRQYHSLLQTYINAKAPAYGFRERLKADNVFPNKSLAAQLVQVDAFKKTAASYLLD